MPHRLPHLLLMILVIAVVADLYLTIKPAFIVAFVSCAGLILFFQNIQGAAARPMVLRALVATIGMPVLAWALPNVWLLYFAMLIWVPLVAARTALVAPVYLYSLLLLPGLDSTAAVGSIKLFEFGVHDALALGAAAALAVKSAKGRPRLALDFSVVALMLMLSVALARDTSITNVMRVAVNVGLDLGLPYYVVSRGIRTMEEFRAALLWLSCGAVTLSSILVYEAWKSWPIYNELYNQYALPTLLLVKSRGGLLRSGGPFVEPTSAAMVLSMCVLAVWLSRDYFRSQWRYLLVMAAVLAGLAAPQSRGAWIGLATAYVAATLFRRRYAQLAQSAVVVGTVIVLLMFAAQSSPFVSELVGLSGNSSETSDYRRLLLSRGMEEFWRSPISGYSMPRLADVLSDLRQGEGIIDFVNTYIWIMLISGAAGLGIFLGTFLFFLGRLMRLRKPVPELPGSVIAATFAFAGLVMPLEMLFFTSFGGRPAFFVFALFGFAAALLTIRDRHIRQRRSEQNVSSRPDDGALGLAAIGPAEQTSAHHASHNARCAS